MKRVVFTMKAEDMMSLLALNGTLDSMWFTSGANEVVHLIVRVDDETAIKMNEYKITIVKMKDVKP